MSAPSDLAIETAERLGVTLVGFLRGDGFNVYAHDDRIDLRDLTGWAERADQAAIGLGLRRGSLTNSKPKRPLMQRWPSVTDESRRRGDLDDPVVLGVERRRAQPTPQYGQIVSVTVWARLVPGAGLAHVVLGLEHQRAGRADADAVAAVDARRLGQRDGLLGRDPGVEAAPGDGDRERVLGVLAARLDALVAEDALRVVADVEVVVDLRRLGDGRGRRVAGRRVVVAGLVGVALAGRRRARPAVRSGSASAP